MRWVPLAILAYAVLLAQTTVGELIRIELPGLGVLRPDLLAMLALFVTLHARSGTDAAIAAWALGFAADLAVGGATGGGTVVGVMALSYAVASGLVYRSREAFFGDRPATQILLGLWFVGVAHGLWVTLQCLLAYPAVGWGQYADLLAQALGVVGYTALLTPIGLWLLKKTERFLISSSPGRSKR